MFIGKSIALARENLNLTQKALANKVGLSPSALSRIESDDRDLTFSTLEKIAQGLGLRVSELMVVAESIRDKDDAIKQIGKEMVLVAQPLLAKSGKRRGWASKTPRLKDKHRRV